ncbi:hypothetical protein BC939DRAFT_233357 [Gamsiella multidivaricata]|uniref:uncharacterized protein n=1 Tax=Gamsiella multidivaricata TaxID=101098 RepID=UPI00221F977B|nr:uncharacterized protein BC939DRAFT_233357 [Gamsiella multidivaricata]KAI7820396.1 hypothetical protein BC939DRAFT_233357 [Gamsiella multidivaricata]
MTWCGLGMLDKVATNLDLDSLSFRAAADQKRPVTKKKNRLHGFIQSRISLRMRFRLNMMRSCRLIYFSTCYLILQGCHMAITMKGCNGTLHRSTEHVCVDPAQPSPAQPQLDRVAAFTFVVPDMFVWCLNLKKYEHAIKESQAQGEANLYMYMCMCGLCVQK